MRSEKAILDSIEAIERTICEIDEMARLMMPLVKLLLPVSKQADIDRLPREGRHIELSKVHFYEQYEKGISRAIGFDIIWI